MSHTLINRNEDLKQLEREGYEIEIRANHLLVKNIPYVDQNKEVRRGTLVSELTMQGDTTVKPHTHVVMFSGDMPCNREGQPLTEIQNSSNPQELGEGLAIDHTFSRKPRDGYTDFHHKMVTYENIISEHARSVIPNITARTFAVFRAQDENSVFEFVDTATSRAGIGAINEKLQIGAVALVGLGGTGSYILDLIAKTPVWEIHLFDGDKFGQHNAFRSPGAPSVEALKTAPSKVEYFSKIYSNMRRNIFVHGYIDESNVHFLQKMNHVFLAVDDGLARKFVVEKLCEYGVPFIDAGMGVLEDESSLRGQLRVTVSTDLSREQALLRLPLFEGGGENEYSRNIQIAELNALNAALAVIAWKKSLGFYVYKEDTLSRVYLIDRNLLLKWDQM